MLRGRRSRTVGAAALAIATLVACSSGDTSATDATPSETAEPAPTPTPPDTVALASHVEVLSLADDDVMTKRTGRAALDQDAIAATSARLVDLLRAHLDDLNAGRQGLLAALADPTLLLADPMVGDLLGTGLADRTNFATEADLTLRIGADGAPRWAEAELDVLRIDGSRSRLGVVFAIAQEMQVVLVSLPEEVVS